MQMYHYRAGQSRIRKDCVNCTSPPKQHWMPCTEDVREGSTERFICQLLFLPLSPSPFSFEFFALPSSALMPFQAVPRPVESPWAPRGGCRCLLQLSRCEGDRAARRWGDAGVRCPDCRPWAAGQAAEPWREPRGWPRTNSIYCWMIVLKSSLEAHTETLHN